MAELNREQSEVNARILYWGIDGSGKTTSIRYISEKLRPDHRGELRQLPTALDPSVNYDLLPIELASVAGVRTRIQIIGVPGGPDHVATRKQLLDRVDGIVFVIDSQRDRLQENLASFEELQTSLAAYGRALTEVPLVLQYNKRDLADPYVLEELHRKLDMRGVAAFESVATEGTAILQTLTTVSKGVIRFLREQARRSPAAPSGPTPAASAPPLGASQFLDAELLAEAAAGAPDVLGGPQASAASEPAAPDLSLAGPDLDAPNASSIGLTIESTGEASVIAGRSVRLPLVVREADGRRLELTLTVTLEEAEEDFGL